MPVRYSLSIFIACLLFASACKQTSPQITIRGHIEGWKDSILFIGLPKEDSYDTFDSFNYYDSDVSKYVSVKNGSFSWSQPDNGPHELILLIGGHRIPLFTGNTNIEIHGHYDSISAIRITGSVAQQEFDAFKSEMMDIWKEELYLRGVLTKVSDTSRIIKDFTPKYDSVVVLRKAKTEQFIAAHPGSIVSVGIIKDMAYDGDPTYLDSLFHLLTPEILASPAGKRLEEKLAVLRRGAVGQPFRDFTQIDVNGDTVRLGDFKGKYLLIYYWLGYAKEQNPDILRLYNCYRKKGFTVLGVFMGEVKEQWKDIIQWYALPWKQVSDLEGMHGSLAREYGVNSVPNNFLLDPKGVIIGRDMSMKELERKLCEVVH